MSDAGTGGYVAPTGEHSGEETMRVVSGSTGITMKIGHDGQRVYPCRCGADHGGTYAIEDWNHHNCFHGPFWMMEPLPEIQQIICSQCGEVFQLLPSEARQAEVPR